jgi:hypothetical protein
MAEPLYPPPSSGAPYDPYDPYAPTQQAYPAGLPPTRRLPADEYAQPAPASAQPASAGAIMPYSAGAPQYAVPEQVIAQIGEIQVTSTTVRTPTCGFPLRGSQWHVVDAWNTTQSVAGWAIALAILLFFCIGPFSLLFLLAKTTHLQGQVQVHVSNGQLGYVSRIMVNNQAYVQQVYAQVNYVRALAAL